MRLQLQQLHICSDNIVICYGYRDYEYLYNLDEKFFDDVVIDIYFVSFGIDIVFKFPFRY